MPTETLMTLFLAHLVADFPLQTNYLFQVKRNSTAGLLLHGGIHALTAFLLTGLRWDLWYVWLFLLGSHTLIDWAKLNYKSSIQWRSFLLDQFIHFLVLIMIALWQPELTSVLPAELLTICFLLAWIPAILMFLWIYSGDVSWTNTDPPTWVVWMQKNMLKTSRLSGYPILAIVLFGLILT